MLPVVNYVCRQARSVTAAATVAVGVTAATCVRNVRLTVFFYANHCLSIVADSKDNDNCGSMMYTFII